MSDVKLHADMAECKPVRLSLTSGELHRAHALDEVLERSASESCSCAAGEIADGVSDGG